MARLVFDENYQVHWLTSAPTTQSSPTVTEIEAGTDITEYVPKDGVTYGSTNNKVDAGNISTLFDAEYMGTYGNSASIELQKDSTDSAVNLFTTHATAGALVVLWNAGASSPAKDDNAYVIPCEASIAAPTDSAANELQTAVVDLAVTSAPSWFATVTT
jgi:hypothetical protein